MSHQKPPNEILRFNNSDPIEVKYENTVNYTNCRTYDHKIMGQGFIWHQIVVQHQGKIKSDDGKQLILDAIFDIVGNEEFFPVAYRQTPKEDKFLIRQCNAAMGKLFASNLKIRLLNGLSLSLKVQLNVAEYKFGQIAPKTRISQAIHRLCKNLDFLSNERGLLNLSGFSGNMEFDGLEIFLSNRAVLECVCDLIYRNDEDFRHINGIILSHNRLKSVAPLQIFRTSYFTLLDLRHNDLNSTSNLCRDLKGVKAKKLLLAGNPLIDSPTYPTDLCSLSKNFKFIDDIPSENLSKDYTPVNHSDVSEESGHLVDINNAADIKEFEKSSYWHCVVIPDPNREYTKEEIFDYFFITVSNDLGPIYPCYYKYSSGEHQFLLRDCFPHIVHLVENCNLEIKIPSLNVMSLDNGPTGIEVMYEKSLKYCLRMNIRPYLHGQIDPTESIEKALGRRFNTMDRLLDLQKFQSSPGLENIIVNFSCPKVLESILCMAGRKFLLNCVEIRLSHNKILSADFKSAFTLMSNVKAVDLDNNWIHDLRDIKSLQTVKLKALRLDGNPLCSQFALAADYIKAVRSFFPDIHKLDNIEINTTGNLSCQKNYLCDVKAYDFVEQFVPYFFNTFQSKQRGNLKGLYHPEALFSITCKYQPTQSTQQNMNRRSRYKKLSRNVLSLEDISLSTKNLYFGTDAIMSVFSKLPDMSFDLLSFTVDVPIFIETMVSIFVTGVLSDQPSNILEAEIILGFSRSLVLIPVKENLVMRKGVLKCAKSYQIIHDLFSVYNPSELQLKNSFKYCKNNELYESEEITTTDKEACLIMFQELTGLKSIWCTRCLGDANWNFEEAMNIFVKLCDKKEIPPAAFI